MSHFSTIKTQIKDLEFLKKALDDLGYSYQHISGQKVQITGYQGKTELVDLAVHTTSEYDIGFNQQQEVYEVVADWWGVNRYTSIRQQEFLSQVNQRYAYHKTIHELEEHNFFVEDEEQQEEVVVLTVKWYE